VVSRVFLLGLLQRVESAALLDTRRRERRRRATLSICSKNRWPHAIGAGLPVSEPTASSLSSTSAAAFRDRDHLALADISVCESVRIAGDDFDEAIVNHMKKTYT